MTGILGLAGRGLHGLFQCDSRPQSGQRAGQTSLNQVLLLIEVDVELVEAGDLAALGRANGVVAQVDEDTQQVMRVMDVRARHVKGCMDEGVATVRGKEQHASASMKNKIKSLFNLMLDYALEYEIVDRNYSRTFKLTDETIKEIQKVKKEHIPFTDEEISKLWEHVDDILNGSFLLKKALVVKKNFKKKWRTLTLNLPN